MMSLCTGGSHKPIRFPYQMTWSGIQAVSWFMVRIPKGMLSVTQQVLSPWKGQRAKPLLELQQQGLEISPMCSKLSSSGKWVKWRDPAALPTAPKITEHLMISALPKCCCEATATLLEGKKRVCFSEWHRSCWAPISLLWWSVALHSLCPWLAEAPRYKMEIFFYRKMGKTVFFILHFIVDLTLFLLKEKSSYTKKMKF